MKPLKEALISQGGNVAKDSLVKDQLNYVINAMAVLHFAEPDKAKGDMETFAGLNDKTLFKLLKTCVDPQTDLRGLLKARNELLRRVEQHHPSLLGTITALIEAGSWNVVNRSSITPLLHQLSKSNKSTYSVVAARLLALMAKECPPMFESHVQELLIAMNDKKHDKLSEVSLQALAALSKADPNLVSGDKKTVDRAIEIAYRGTVRQAKFAARLVAYSLQKERCGELIDGILDHLSDKKEARLPPLLRALGELALSAPVAFEEKSAEVLRIVLKDVVQKDMRNQKDEEDWDEEENLSHLERAKLEGLRICTHRVLGWARNEQAVAIATPVFEMFHNILLNDGKVTEGGGEGGSLRPHMRLRAASYMLKLARARVLDKAMTTHFEVIAMTLQDPLFQVRSRFLKKVGEALRNQRILPRWNILPALIAKDPDNENILLGRSLIQNVAKQWANFPLEEKIERVEIPFARLIRMLTYHPDLRTEKAGLRNVARCMELYLDCVTNRDNISLLYGIAQKLKAVRDAMIPDLEGNELLYQLSDLGQIILRNKAAQHQWAITSYPGTVRLPRDIFHNLSTPEERNRNVRRQFLPEDDIAWASSLGKKAIMDAGNPRQRVTAASASTPKKRASKPRISSGSRTKRKVSGKSDDSEDELDSSENDEEEEGEDASEEEDGDEAGEEEMEVDGAEQVLGRGGKRGAKTKAKKAVNKKRKTKPRAESEELLQDS